MNGNSRRDFSELIAAARIRDLSILEHAVAQLTDVPDLPANERFARLHAAALAFGDHYRRFGDDRSAERMEAFARLALDALGPDAEDLERARALDALANALYWTGRERLDDTRTGEAEALFRQAVDLIDEATFPADWCRCTLSLAAVSASRHRSDGGAEHRTRTDALYCQVRRVAARRIRGAGRAEAIQIWASAANNMLRTERDAACAAGSVAAIRRSLLRLRRVLRLREIGAQADDLADNRHLVAITLAELADRDYGRPLLDQAVALWRENLAAIPQAEDPLRWTQFTNSLGVAHMTIGEKENDVDAYGKAEALFLSVADVPSARRRGRGAGPSNRPTPLWTQGSHFNNYVTALTNLVQVREQLAGDDRTSARLYANLDDLGAIDPALLSGNRSTAATLAYLRARSAMALWGLTRLQEHQDVALASLMAAAKGFESIDAPTYEAHVLTIGTQFLLASAPAADPLDVFREAEGLARRALERLPPDASDIRVSAWRLHAEARLAAAAWRHDIAAVSEIGHEIETFLERDGQNLSPIQRSLLRLARLDADSALARLDGSTGAYRLLLASIERFPTDGAEAATTIRIRLDMARGHARRALGDLDGAIEVWARLQEAVWTALRERPASVEADLITVGVGRTGHALATGRGLSLADELATALVARGSAQDVASALSALDRGRAIAAAGRRATTPLGRTLLNRIRHVEQRIQAELRLWASREPHGDRAPPRQTLTGLEQRKSSLEARFGAAETEIPSVNDAVGALPPDAALAIVSLAERDAALIVVEKGPDGTASRRAMLLPGLNRTVVDRLLLGQENGEGGLLGAIDGLRPVDAGGFASTDAFLTAVEALHRVVAQAEAVLGPTMLEPVRAAVAQTTTRIAWLLPGALWPFPLHAMQADAAGRPVVQSYLRSLHDIRPRRAESAGLAPRMLVVDAFEGDGGPTPFGDDRLDHPIFAARARFPVTARSPNKARLARLLATTEIFFFNGHGRYFPSDPDRSGLVGAEPERPDLAEAEPDLLLTTSALRGIPVRDRPLAILSACDVGTIDLLHDPEEFIGLPGELIDLGFRSVVAATWPVARAATADLIGRFVAKLPETLDDPASALASAQTEFGRAKLGIFDFGTQRVDGTGSVMLQPPREIAAISDLPYWWAGFRAIGLGIPTR